MLMEDDPKEPAEVEPDLDEEEQEDEAPPEEEPEAETTDEAEDEEGAPEDDEDADLPSDPKVLKRMLRQAQMREQHATETLRQSLRREPPTREEEPDEVAATLAALEADPAAATPKALALILKREQQREVSAARKEAAADALAKLPEKHRADVSEIATRFNLPVTVAHAIYKGALYDRAMERRKAKQEPTAEAAEPSRPQGKAPQTRPVRRGAPPSNGAGYIVVEGLKIKTKQKPGEYETFMDSLPLPKRRIVLALRREGKVSVE